MRLKKDYKAIYISSSMSLLANQKCKQCSGIGYIGRNFKSHKVVHCRCLIAIRFLINYIKIYDM